MDVGQHKFIYAREFLIKKVSLIQAPVALKFYLEEIEWISFEKTINEMKGL